MLSSGEVAHSIKEVLADDNRPYNRFQHIVVCAYYYNYTIPLVMYS